MRFALVSPICLRDSAKIFIPTTHFVKLAQAILFRGAGLSVVWPQFIALALIGSGLFAVSLARFRKTIGLMA
jgi:ABC-2 type transport system permease protein